MDTQEVAGHLHEIAYALESFHELQGVNYTQYVQTIESVLSDELESGTRIYQFSLGEAFRTYLLKVDVAVSCAQHSSEQLKNAAQRTLPAASRAVLDLSSDFHHNKWRAMREAWRPAHDRIRTAKMWAGRAKDSVPETQIGLENLTELRNTIEDVIPATDSLHSQCVESFTWLNRNRPPSGQPTVGSSIA